MKKMNECRYIVTRIPHGKNNSDHILKLKTDLFDLCKVCINLLDLSDLPDLFKVLTHLHDLPDLLDLFKVSTDLLDVRP